MPGIDMYWLEDKNSPFATSLTVLQTYYHSEVRNLNFALLSQRIRQAASDDVEMTTFKKEFVQLLEGNREGLKPGAIDLAADYAEWDTDDEFLTWLWYELYPDEPLPQASRTEVVGNASAVVDTASYLYWLEEEDAPFATFLTVLQTYYHPEMRHDNFELLPLRARRAAPDDVEMATFKEELVQLLEGNREGLRPGAIDAAAVYDEWHTDDEFLAWLWRELYPEEPVPGQAR